MRSAKVSTGLKHLCKGDRLRKFAIVSLEKRKFLGKFKAPLPKDGVTKARINFYIGR